MSDKLIKLNEQFLHIECSRGIGTIAIERIDEAWGGTVSDPHEDVTQIWLLGRESPIELKMPHSAVEAIIAGPPDPRQQIVAFVNGQPQTQATLDCGLDELTPFFQFARNVEEHLSRRGEATGTEVDETGTEATGTEATIYDDMTVADAIAVLQQFNPNASLILQAVLPSGEVHGLPLKVFQKQPHAAVGMTMRCHPNSTVETFGGTIPVQSNRGSND